MVASLVLRFAHTKMKAKHSRILTKYHTKHRNAPSELFARLDLIKDALEVFEYGVPTIIKALREDGATDGLSLSNVQGFIDRARKKGLIGEKGCRKSEMDEDGFDESQQKLEKICSPDDEHCDSGVSTGKKANEVSNPKRKPKGPSKKSVQTQGVEAVLRRGSLCEDGNITLPEKGPIDEKTWLAFVESQKYPLDSAGNIDVKEYAKILDQEGVDMLDDTEYNVLAGYFKSWRAQPERNISETWAAGVAQRATKLKRQMRGVVGLE